MNKLEDYKAKMRARKAAALGMTVEHFDAHCEAELLKQREINQLLLNRDRQWAAIAANANFFKRSFSKLA